MIYIRKVLLTLMILLLILVLVVAMASCGTSTPSAPPQNNQQQAGQPAGNHPSQTELNAELKRTAVKADFIELNSDTAPLQKKVYAEGVVSVVMKAGNLGEFMLATEDPTGAGVYIVKNYDLDNPVNDGDVNKIVTAWGSFAGKDAGTGIPVIWATVIEKK